jgi:hypothetical protein
VIPPRGAQFEEPDVIKRITEALHEEFPEAAFMVADGERWDAFIVYPILGTSDSDTPMARMPAEGAVAKILDFLEANFGGIPKPGVH